MLPTSFSLGLLFSLFPTSYEYHGALHFLCTGSAIEGATVLLTKLSYSILPSCDPSCAAHHPIHQPRPPHVARQCSTPAPATEDLHGPFVCDSYRYIWSNGGGRFLQCNSVADRNYQRGRSRVDSVYLYLHSITSPLPHQSHPPPFVRAPSVFALLVVCQGLPRPIQPPPPYVAYIIVVPAKPIPFQTPVVCHHPESPRYSISPQTPLGLPSPTLHDISSCAHETQFHCASSPGPLHCLYIGLYPALA